MARNESASRANAQTQITALALREYLAFVRTVNIIHGIWDRHIADPTVHCYASRKSNVLDLVCQYLAAITMAQNSLETGRNGPSQD